MIAAFAAGREASYPRNASVLLALGQSASVHELTSEAPSLTLKLAQVAGHLLRARTRDWDLLFLGFYGQPLVLPARLRWSGPLILDAFVSTYDTYCFDRQVFGPRSPLGRMAFYLDRLSCQMADVVVVDTLGQARYFERTFAVPRSKIKVLYVGCDDQLFAPRDVPLPDRPRVLFYGTFLPLHGVDTIIRAANLMRTDDVDFVLLGRGQEYERARGLAAEFDLSNIEFLDPVPLEQLPGVIAEATICLGGHFGRSQKARRVIAGKTFQCLAMGKPTIVGDNPANRELFSHGEDVWMCPMDNPPALTESIRHLLDSSLLRARLGKRARETVRRTSGRTETAKAVRAIIDLALAAHHSGSPSSCS
jgi:glycosyltransferase involved in cell wall biosynthesis